MARTLSPSNGVLGVKSPVRIFLDSEKHLDWLKIDLNAAEIITVKTINAQKRPKPKENHLGILKIYICQKFTRGLPVQ